MVSKSGPDIMRANRRWGVRMLPTRRRGGSNRPSATAPGHQEGTRGCRGDQQSRYASEWARSRGASVSQLPRRRRKFGRAEPQSRQAAGNGGYPAPPRQASKGNESRPRAVGARVAQTCSAARSGKQKRRPGEPITSTKNPGSQSQPTSRVQYGGRWGPRQATTEQVLRPCRRGRGPNSLAACGGAPAGVRGTAGRVHGPRCEIRSAKRSQGHGAADWGGAR